MTIALVIWLSVAFVIFCFAFAFYKVWDEGSLWPENYQWGSAIFCTFIGVLLWPLFIPTGILFVVGFSFFKIFEWILREILSAKTHVPGKKK